MGGGSVGLQLAGRLARAGHAPRLIVRRPEQERALARHGVVLWDPASDERHRVRVEASCDLAAVAELEAPVVLLATRVRETRAVADELAGLRPDAAVASAQNDVVADAWLAERFAAVAGVVVRQTCSRRGEHEVAATGAGRVVVGAVTPAGASARDALHAAFAAAGFDAGRSDDLAADRWLKLCVNLMSVTNALVCRSDHRTADFTEAKARLLEEARDALAAAGIRAASGDGRDRDLPAEIAAQREALARGTSARDLPLYNAVWSALTRGGDLEAEAYHRRIVELARAHGGAAPYNARAVELLREAAEAGRGPEQLPARALHPAPRPPSDPPA